MVSQNVHFEFHKKKMRGDIIGALGSPHVYGLPGGRSPDFIEPLYPPIVDTIRFNKKKALLWTLFSNLKGRLLNVCFALLTYFIMLTYSVPL